VDSEWQGGISFQNDTQVHNFFMKMLSSSNEEAVDAVKAQAAILWSLLNFSQLLNWDSRP
jgi:hypothetical protein